MNFLGKDTNFYARANNKNGKISHKNLYLYQESSYMTIMVPLNFPESKEFIYTNIVKID
jgi:hypothetical protein